MRGALTLFGMAGLIAMAGGCCSPSSGPAGMGAGSVAHANVWRERFQQVGDPDAARKAFAGIVAKRFSGGEWVFGVSEDSHASPEGGTIVLKDSRGRVRAFFGHVCGPRYLEGVLLSAETLDGVYEELQTGKAAGWRYGEYLFPPED